MKTSLRLEELAQFILCAVLFYQQGYAWWVFPAVILLPDISMLGYLFSPAMGAICYNFVHHKAGAILVFAGGIYLAQPFLLASGLVLFAHSAMDRIFGYGLKYPDSFANTHLGKIGK